MRLNKYLASTLFTGLFFTAAYLSPATAQEQSLQPQGAWAITKIDRSSEGGNSYCTLSRKYDDGVVLSLGRNATEEYSLAIDFQKPVFEKDKSLKINLQPGPGQIRAYDMMPTSEKAVVIRLGWDTGFFDSLNQSQQMKVKISDKSYSFAMPEITKGQGDLQDCMEGLKTAGKAGEEKTAKAETKDVLNAEAGKASGEFAAGKSAASTTANVEAQEKGLLASFAESFTAQEPELRKNNNEDAPARQNFNSKSAKKNSADERPAPVETAEAKTDVPEPELIRRPPPSDKVLPAPSSVQDNKSQQKAAEKLAMTAPAASPEALPPVAAKVASKEEPKEAVKEDKAAIAAAKAAEKAEADKAAAQAKATADAQSNAAKELARLQSEKQALQQRLDLAKAEQEKLAKPEEVAAVQARAKELEIKNKQLEDSLRQAQVRIGEAAVNTENKGLRKIAELETKLAAAQADNNALAKQLESYKLQQEDGRLSMVAGDWNLENATKRYNEAEREIRRLGLQLEQERSSCNREKADIEQMLFDPALADKQQIQRLTKLEDDLAAANAKLADQSKAIQDAVNAQLATKTQSLEAEKAAAQAQVAGLQKSLADREASIATLQKNAGDSQTAAAEKAQMAQQITALQASLTAKDQELAAAKAKPAADPQQIAALTAQNKSLTDAIAAKDKAIADAQAAAAAAAAAPKDADKMKDHIAALEKSQSALKSEADALRDQNIILRADSEKLRLQLADVIGSSSSRTDQVASMHLEMDTMRRQLQTKDTQNATYQNQIAVLQQETAQLKNRLTVASDTGKSNTDEVSELTRQVQQLQKQISNMDKRESISAAPVAMPIPAPIPTPILRERTVSAEQLDKVTPAAGTPSSATSVYTQSAEPKAAGFDAGNINGLLQKAGVGNNGVQKAAGGFAGAENYSWTDSSNVRGLASVKSLGSASFDTMVDQYIGYQRGQCGSGDFASMPSPTNGSATKRMALYEIACVKGGDNTASSLIFFEDNGRFIAISNQIGAADMDIAMDSRDKIAGFVRGL